MTGGPALDTVAREAGASIPTVSQVMRGTGRISDKTRTRVLEAAKKLHYVPATRAASMRSGCSREIGLAINRISNPFNAEIISGASDLPDTEGYLVSALDTRDDAVRQGRHLEAFIRRGRDGLLRVPAIDTADGTFDMFSAQGLPIATFLRRAHPQVTAVMCNGDMVALGACHALVRSGLRPGRDVSMAGFDDIPDAPDDNGRLALSPGAHARAHAAGPDRNARHPVRGHRRPDDPGVDRGLAPWRKGGRDAARPRRDTVAVAAPDRSGRSTFPSRRVFRAGQ